MGQYKMKKETLEHTIWRTRFGRGYGPVVRHCQKDDLKNILISKVTQHGKLCFV